MIGRRKGVKVGADSQPEGSGWVLALSMILHSASIPISERRTTAAATAALQPLHGCNASIPVGYRTAACGATFCLTTKLDVRKSIEALLPPTKNKHRR